MARRLIPMSSMHSGSVGNPLGWPQLEAKFSVVEPLFGAAATAKRCSRCSGALNEAGSFARYQTLIRGLDPVAV